MDMSAAKKKICPFRAAVGSTCVEENCALYYQEISEDSNPVSGMNGCSFKMIAQYLDETRYHISTTIANRLEDIESSINCLGE